MNDFMNSEFNIEDIVLACYVPEGKGMTVHRKEGKAGLRYIQESEKYVFENGKNILCTKRYYISAEIFNI